MFWTFTFLNLQATYGGWVIYRNGEMFARSFPTRQDAVAFARDFCIRNGFTFREGR